MICLMNDFIGGLNRIFFSIVFNCKTKFLVCSTRKTQQKKVCVNDEMKVNKTSGKFQYLSIENH